MNFFESILFQMGYLIISPLHLKSIKWFQATFTLYNVCTSGAPGRLMILSIFKSLIWWSFSVCVGEGGHRSTVLRLRLGKLMELAGMPLKSVAQSPFTVSPDHCSVWCWHHETPIQCAGHRDGNYFSVGVAKVNDFRTWFTAELGLKLRT